MKSDSEEEDLIDALNRLQEGLRENNNASIGNLSALSNSIQHLFTFFRNAFLALTRQRDTLQLKLANIEAKLRIHHLTHILESDEMPQETANCSNELEQINRQMRLVIRRKNGLGGFTEGQTIRKAKKSSPSHRQKTSEESNRATRFARDHLADKLEETSHSADLPKNAILNLYLQWSQKQSRPVDYQFLSSVQMALTNELKRLFPSSAHNSRSFRGLQFRQQYRPLLNKLLKTDVKSRQELERNSDEESPPLPVFADDHLAT